MRVGIDVRYLSHGLVGGINTFLRNLIPALIQEVGSEDSLYFYADTKQPFDLEVERDKWPMRVALRLLPYRGPLSSARYDLFISRVMAHDAVDVAHFPANVGFATSPARSVITLHDEINLLPLREIWRGHPKRLNTIGMMTYLHFMTTAAARRADLIVTISEYARRRIADAGGIDPQKIVAVPHGCPVNMKRVEDPETLATIHRRLGVVKPFILAEAFKNPGVIVRAWKALPESVRSRHEIVFFARSPNAPPPVREAVDAGWAKFLVRLPASDLAALYSTTRAFVFPSWIEGFGLPLVEAMTCGAPIIASDRAAIPEVVGDAALLMDAEDDEKLVEHLLHLLQHPEKREWLRQLGFRRAPMFTWANAARGYLEVYAEVFKHSLKGRQPVLGPS